MQQQTNGLSQPVTRRECDISMRGVFHRLDRIDSRVWALLFMGFITMVGVLGHAVVAMMTANGTP